MYSFRDHSISFCPVSVSIKLLRPYFNQQYYIMLYVYVIVCCFRAHSVISRFDRLLILFVSVRSVFWMVSKVIIQKL